MVRIALSCLTIIVLTAAPVAAAGNHTGGANFSFGDGSVRNQSTSQNTTFSGPPPVACDCSNCSAEHCPKPKPSTGGGSSKGGGWIEIQGWN